MRADRQLNRAKLLHAAATLVVARGAQVSMRDIADAAEVSPSTLYRLFDSKTVVLTAVAVEGWRATHARVCAQRARARPGAINVFERAVRVIADDFVRADDFIRAAGYDPGAVEPFAGVVHDELVGLYDIVVPGEGERRRDEIGDVLAIAIGYRAPDRVAERVALMVDALTPAHWR